MKMLRTVEGPKDRANRTNRRQQNQ